MSVELGAGKPRSIDFTFNGKPLAVRRLPLRLGLKLQNVGDGDTISSDIVAEFISTCVVHEDGSSVWNPDDVLDFDAAAMMSLFSEVSGLAVSTEEAEKN